MGLLLPTDDVLSITERVQCGDATVGWRGDPEMDVYLDDRTGEVAVYGFDAHRQRYLVTVIGTWDPGWRHELLRRLRDGDWQNPDAYQRAVDAELRREADKDAALAEQTSACAERFAWAVRRDCGHVVGQSRDFY